MKYRLGVDTGGTFTDVSLISEDSGESYVTKVPSTPENSSIGVLNGAKQIILEAGITYNDLSFFIHGSTVATNTLLEKKGARTALLTTKGFKDILQIGRQTRPKLYDFRARQSNPLIPRNQRWEIDERVDSRGEIIKEVDEKETQKLINLLEQNNIESVVISFINSFLNSRNEQKVKEIILKHLPHTSVTLSTEVLPEIKEYERTSTAVVNGYVMPKMKYYLEYLERYLKEINIIDELYIMQSNGGIISTEAATKMPVRTMLSGPAGGVITGRDIAEKTKYKNLITIDMGGTSLDTSLIENKVPKYTTDSDIEDYPIHVPMVEMRTIGSGGGSIAWIDSGGALRVGPQSAGAEPGPVCYGKGGMNPTVSDANVILGRINPVAILGGKMKMDLEKAKKVMKEKIAKPLGMTVEEAAEGVLKVVNTNIVRGIRVISVEKGHDTREFSLLAFGGAGPLHAGDIAEELECKNIIVPPDPGIACANGMLIADVRHDYVQSYISVLDIVNKVDLNKKISELYTSAVADLRKEGFTENKMDFHASLDLRYEHQAYEINVPIEDLKTDKNILNQAKSNFHQNHKKIYGFNRKEAKLEIVNIRLIGFGRINKPQEKYAKKETKDIKKPNEVTNRDVYFNGSFVKTPIYNRENLYPTTTIKGPSIIEQLDSTVVINPNRTAKIDQYNNIIIN